LGERYAWTCFCLGKPLVGQRVWDLVRCLDYLQSRRDVDQSRIYGLGDRGAALAVLFSGVLDDRMHSMLLDHPIAAYASVVESKAYTLDLSWFLFNVLKHFDLPDLTALLAPRRCWIYNAADSKGEVLAESDVLSIYHRAVEAFKQSNAGGKLRFEVRPEHERAKVFHAWLETV
jgi:hypothetical protein